MSFCRGALASRFRVPELRCGNLRVRAPGGGGGAGGDQFGRRGRDEARHRGRSPPRSEQKVADRHTDGRVSETSAGDRFRGRGEGEVERSVRRGRRQSEEPVEGPRGKNRQRCLRTVDVDVRGCRSCGTTPISRSRFTSIAVGSSWPSNPQASAGSAIACQVRSPHSSVDFAGAPFSGREAEGRFPSGTSRSRTSEPRGFSGRKILHDFR